MNISRLNYTNEYMSIYLAFSSCHRSPTVDCEPSSDETSVHIIYHIICISCDYWQDICSKVYVTCKLFDSYT